MYWFGVGNCFFAHCNFACQVLFMFINKHIFVDEMWLCCVFVGLVQIGNQQSPFMQRHIFRTFATKVKTNNWNVIPANKPTGIFKK